MKAGSTLRADFRAISKRQMDDSAFTAIERIESERLICLHHAVRCSLCGEPQFLHPKVTVIFAVKRDAGVILAGYADDFQSEHLKRQKSFTLVGKKQVAIVAFQHNLEVRMFEFGINVSGRRHREFEIETGVANESGKKIRDLLSVKFDRVFGIGHACLFPTLRFGFHDNRNQRTIFCEFVDEQLLYDADQVAGKPI